ncbi:MAG: hypothetical protein D3925_16925, partial [Candidatus Electrothrix sp. AR5]|nr:hypothetical protein [Candidatus Electrothrix sp. AR5]
AEQFFDKAFQIDPNNPVALIGKAELLARMGRLDEAEQLFDTAFQVDPNNPVALIGKAELLARMGRLGEAEQLFDKAFQVDPNNPVVLTGKAELLARTKNFHEAEQLFDEAYQLDPNNVVPLTGKAELLVHIGRVAEAEELFDRAHRIDPNNVDALTGKAELLARIGSSTEAEEFFDKAHQIDPNEVVPLVGKAHLVTQHERTTKNEGSTINPPPFSFGMNIAPDQVNYNGNYPYAGNEKGAYREETVEVRALPCNVWGLYQMHGNVREYCRDWHGDYPKEPVIDPDGAVTGRYRACRGGSWFGYGRFCRSAYRDRDEPDSRNYTLGFRLACKRTSLNVEGKS